MSVDGVVAALLYIEVSQWLRLPVVDFEPFADGVRIVIGTACVLSALFHAVYKFVFRHFKTDYGVQACAALLQQSGEGFGLRNGAGESVKNHASGSFVRVLVKHVCQDLKH